MQEMVYGSGEIAEGFTHAELDPSDIIPNYSVAKIKNTMGGLVVAVPPSSGGRKSKSAGPPRKRPRKGKGPKGRGAYREEEDEDEEEEEEMEEEEDGQDGEADLADATEDVQKDETYTELERKILFNDYLRNSPHLRNGDKKIQWRNDIAYGENGKPQFDLEILTVVASVNLAEQLDLKYIAQNSRNVEYNPKRFSPLIMRVRYPKSTALLFTSGKMIVAGTKTKEECKLAVRKYARIIQKLGYRVNYADFEVQNISASGNLRFPVRVHDMAKDENIQQFVSYEAEIFPGLVYSLVYPKVKAIIFVTGAVLMTGAKSEEQVRDALESIYPIARAYIKYH
jgi:transcription initiation factor TFIID TATA-box-binding protein